MGKNMTRIARSNAKVLYKNSKTSICTVSKNLSSTRTVSSACLKEIKNTLSKKDPTSEKQDFCVETENCILRRFVKTNRHKLDSLASSHSDKKPKPKFKAREPKADRVNNSPKPIKNDNPIKPFNVETLMIDNLKTLLKIWIEKYVAEFQSSKFERPRRRSRYQNQFDVLEETITSQHNGYTSRYSLVSSRTRTKISTRCSCCSYYTIPLCGERLRIISTLSIPRPHHKNKKPRYLNKNHCLTCKMSRRIHGKIRVQMKKSKDVAIEFSDISLLEISRRHKLRHSKLHRRVKNASILDASLTEDLTNTDRTDTVCDNTGCYKIGTCTNNLGVINSLVKSVYSEHPSNKGDCEVIKPACGLVKKTITKCNGIPEGMKQRRTNEIQCNVLTIEDENILKRNNKSRCCQDDMKPYNFAHRNVKTTPKIAKTNATSGELRSLLDDELSNYLKPLLRHENVKLDIKVKMNSTENDTSTNTAEYSPTTTLDSKGNSNKSKRVERIPIIFPLLDGSLNQNNFATTNSTAPSQNTADQHEKHFRQKTIVKAELIPEISELKVVVKDLANITEDFLNKLTKRKTNSKSQYVQVTDSRLRKSDNRTAPIKATAKINKIQSYHYFESETLLEVTDMTTCGSSNNAHLGKVDAAITCSLPKSVSLYEDPESQKKIITSCKTEGTIIPTKVYNKTFVKNDKKQVVSDITNKRRFVPKDLELKSKDIVKVSHTSQTNKIAEFDVPSLCNQCGIDIAKASSSVFIEIQPAEASTSRKVMGKKRKVLTLVLIYGIVIGIPLIVASVFAFIEYYPKLFKPPRPKRLPLVGEFTLSELGLDHL